MPELIEIRIPGKGKILYTYDNSGTKWKKIVYDSTGTTPTITTWLYMQNFVYKDDTLQFFMHEEGRARYDTSETTTGELKKFNYDYFLKDHLGNTRMVLTKEKDTAFYPMATLEDDKRAQEGLYYDIKPAQVKEVYPVLGNDTSNLASRFYRVNGNIAGQKTGLGIVLKVMAGDVVSFRADSYYALPGDNAGPDYTVPLTELLSAFAGSVPVAAHGLSVTDISAITGNTGNLSTFLNTTTGTAMANAHLNWVLFDEQFKYVEGDADAVGAPGLKNHMKFINSPAIASKSGYLYIFISNRSAVDVFFDNLVVTHYKGPILEETHYYPFGLTMAGISSKAIGKLENKLRFNGNELQSKEFSDGNGLELYDFNTRNYDPQLGRFNQPDAFAEAFEDYSPYVFAFNNPVLLNDFDGLAADTSWKELQPVEVVAKVSPKLDTENGQVYSAIPWWQAMLSGSNRIWNGYTVDYRGYVKPYLENIFEMPDIGLKKAAGKEAAELAGKWLIYRAYKRVNGVLKLYIGKAKFRLSYRYSAREIEALGAEAIKALSELPDNATALGVEQAILELNGGLNATSNIKNAAVKKIYVEAGLKWLNENMPNWKEVFKYQ